MKRQCYQQQPNLYAGRESAGGGGLKLNFYLLLKVDLNVCHLAVVNPQKIVNSAPLCRFLACFNSLFPATAGSHFFSKKVLLSELTALLTSFEQNMNIVWVQKLENQRINIKFN